MSDQFTDEGFQKKNETDILEEKEQLFSDLFDVMNYDPSDVLWQWIKLQSLEREEIELLIEIASDQMSIQTAQGVFLDKWGQMLGIERKGEQFAQGYVEVTTEISGSPFTVSAGSRFTSASSTYESDSLAEIPYEIEMTKNTTGESDDYFPTYIDSVASIEEIVDTQGNTISDDYYTLNSKYKNHIEWESGSSLIKNEEYTVRISGNVTRRIEVTCTTAGTGGNAIVGSITTCVDYPSLSVTNDEQIDGGADEESDSAYRQRLLDAQSRNFTLNAIQSHILDFDSVRSCKVYQNTGVDQTPISNWDSPNIGSDLELTGTFLKYSQQFVPGSWSDGDSVATLGKITLHGRAVNDPPGIYCGIKPNYQNTGFEDYYDYTKLEEYELEPSETGYQDLDFSLRYNGLDNTKTYRFDIWSDDPDSSNFDWEDNYWSVRSTTEGYLRGTNDDRGMLYKIENGTHIEQGTGLDMMFKTGYNAAGYSIIIAPEDGYGFENIKTDIEDYLGYVDEGGYSPISIQYYIKESDEITIDVKCTIFITELANFSNVRRELVDDIEDYLESIKLGDNVRYAVIWQTIMNHTQVTNLKNLFIKRSSLDEWTTTDIGILDDEIADLGTTSFQQA